MFSHNQTILNFLADGILDDHEAEKLWKDPGVASMEEHPVDSWTTIDEEGHAWHRVLPPLPRGHGSVKSLYEDDAASEYYEYRNAMGNLRREYRRVAVAV